MKASLHRTANNLLPKIEKKMNKTLSITLLSMLFLSLAMVPNALAPPANCVYVDPPTQTFGPGDVVDTEFTVQVRINASGLYGLDIRLGWNDTYLALVNTNTTVGVETYPGGVLHETVLTVRDEAIGTDAWVWVYSSMLPAAEWTGDGMLAEMTFRIIKQPQGVLGEPAVTLPLDIYLADLADIDGAPIDPVIYDGEVIIEPTPFEVPPYPVLRVVPANVSHVALGELFEVDVDVTDLDPFWDLSGFDVKLGFDNTILEATQVTVDPDGWLNQYYPGGVFEIKCWIDIVGGYAQAAALGLPGINGTHTPPSGNGTLATVTLKPKDAGISDLNLYDTELASFPHPERALEPWNNKPWSVPINHEVSHGLFSKLAPVARFSYSPTQPTIWSSIVFNASESYSDPISQIANYTWDFGDGTPIVTVTEALTTHAYTNTGTYDVTLTVTDNEGFNGSITHSVTVSPLRPSLDVELDVGSMHFPGETAEFYATVALQGELVNGTIDSAKLYFAGAFYRDLTATPVATGVYRMPFAIPLDASNGTYTLVVEVSYLGLKGTALKSFLISGWLSATLVDIKDEIATIEVKIDGLTTEIRANLTEIQAKLVTIEGAIATLNSTLGDIQVDVTVLQDDIGGVQSTVATMLPVASIFSIIATIVAIAAVVLLWKSKKSI